MDALEKKLDAVNTELKLTESELRDAEALLEEERQVSIFRPLSFCIFMGFSFLFCLLRVCLQREVRIDSTFSSTAEEHCFAS